VDGFYPDFNFDGVDTARRMIRRVKAEPVLMAQLIENLSEGLFQIAHFAAEVTPGGNLRQPPQKINRIFVALLDAACSSPPAGASVLTLARGLTVTVQPRRQ
jgi:hypothetical protein